MVTRLDIERYLDEITAMEKWDNDAEMSLLSLLFIW